MDDGVLLGLVGVGRSKIVSSDGVSDMVVLTLEGHDGPRAEFVMTRVAALEVAHLLIDTVIEDLTDQP